MAIDTVKANIAKVAGGAGVSKAVVSSILGGGSTSVRYSADTKRRVLQMAKQLDYTPPITHVIGIVHSIAGNKPSNVDWVQWVAPMLASIHNEALRSNRMVAVFNYSFAEIGSLINHGDMPQVFRRKKIDGLILAGCLNESLIAYTEQNRLPHILMNISDANVYAEDSICFDEIFTGFQATSHLLELGHKRIMHVTVDRLSSHYSQCSRRFGYEMAMRNAALPERVLRLHSDEQEKFMAQLKQVLNEPDRPTAIFAYNEEIAILCFRVLSDMQVPFSDVNVIAVGWQDIKSMGLLGISYVHLPAFEMGRQCFNMILQKVENSITTPTVSLRGTIKSLRSTTVLGV